MLLVYNQIALKEHNILLSSSISFSYFYFVTKSSTLPIPLFFFNKLMAEIHYNDKIAEALMSSQQLTQTIFIMKES